MPHLGKYCVAGEPVPRRSRDARGPHLDQALHLANPEAPGGVVAGHEEVLLPDADGLSAERRVEHLFDLFFCYWGGGVGAGQIGRRVAA